MSTLDEREHNPTIYIVDDEESVREPLRALSEQRGYHVFTFESAEDFLNEFDGSLLSCLLIDINLPSMSGLDLQEQLLRRGQRPPLLFISGKGNISQSVQAIKSGAIDYIEKPFLPSELFKKVESALTTEIERRKTLEEEDAILKRFANLTEREWEVLRSTLTGPKVLSSKEVAKELNLSHRTVDHHRSNIMMKTKTPSMADLIKLASLAGIIGSESGVEPETS